MTEIQTWTLIGVIVTLVMGVLGWQSVFLFRIMRTEFGRVHDRLDASRELMEVRFGSVDKRIDGLDKRIDGLDRDVQALTRRAFGGEAPAS